MHNLQAPSRPVSRLEMAVATGASPNTIDSWVKLGLLPEPQWFSQTRKGWPPAVAEQALAELPDKLKALREERRAVRTRGRPVGARA